MHMVTIKCRCQTGRPNKSTVKMRNAPVHRGMRFESCFPMKKMLSANHDRYYWKQILINLHLIKVNQF